MATIRTTLYGAERNGASVNGNPKWTLATADGVFHTQADAACSYDVDNLRREADHAKETGAEGINVTLYTTARAGRVWRIDRGHTPDTLRVTVRDGNGKRAPWAPWDTDGSHPHFRVTFTCEDRRYTIDFWGSSASTAASEQAAAHGIVECVDNDANAGRESFRDFCDEHGYDEDSRKAHATWVACKRVAARWERLLGGRELARDESGELVPAPGGVALA